MTNPDDMFTLFTIMNTYNKTVSSSPSRRERARLATQSEILDTAREQIAQEGAPALSLRAIARKMGLTAPALYRYFQNRDELVTALIVEAYASLGDALTAARDKYAAATRLERLAAMMSAYRTWGITHPQDYALIFGTPIPGYHAPAEITGPYASRAMGVLAMEIAEAMAAGEITPAPEYAKPSPTIQAQMEQWRDAYGYVVPSSALHLALIGWTRAHGMTSLEIFEQIPPSLGDPGDLYRNEVQVLLKQIGFQTTTDQ